MASKAKYPTVFDYERRASASFYFIFLAFVFASPHIWAASVRLKGSTSPEIVMKVYRLWFSSDMLCVSPIKVAEISGGKWINFQGGSTDTLGVASIPSGTYRCMILEISDRVKIIPNDKEDTDCIIGRTYTQDICSAVDKTLGPEGSLANCTSGEDKVFVYVSKFSTGRSTVFLPPTHLEPNGLKLRQEFVIKETQESSQQQEVSIKVVTEINKSKTRNCTITRPEFEVHLSN